MHGKIFELQASVEVNVIQVQQRQHPGIGALASRERAKIGALEVLLHQLRGQAASPFIEVAEDDAGTCESRVAEDLTAEQLRPLVAPLHISGAEMHVKGVQNASVVELFNQ